MEPSNYRLVKKTLKYANKRSIYPIPSNLFATRFASENLVNTFNIHINYGFYTKAQYALLNSDEKLLDAPYEEDSSYKYMNQLHYRTSSFNKLIQAYPILDEGIFSN